MTARLRARWTGMIRSPTTTMRSATLVLCSSDLIYRAEHASVGVLGTGGAEVLRRREQVRP